MSLKSKRRRLRRARKRLSRIERGLPERYPLRRKVEAAIARPKAALLRSIQRLSKRIRAKQDSGERVITRAEWGAAPPRGGYVVNSTITKRVQHHTVYPALSPRASVADEARRMRQIQAGHFARGFADIGYHRVVFPSGRVYEGRPDRYIGAGVAGHNTGSVHVAADGNYDVQEPTDALVRGCKRAFQSMPGSDSRLYGHRDLEPNICPGKHLYARLDEIA